MFAQPNQFKCSLDAAFKLLNPIAEIARKGELHPLPPSSIKLLEKLQKGLQSIDEALKGAPDCYSSALCPCCMKPCIDFIPRSGIGIIFQKNKITDEPQYQFIYGELCSACVDMYKEFPLEDKRAVGKSFWVGVRANYNLLKSQGHDVLTFREMEFQNLCSRSNWKGFDFHSEQGFEYDMLNENVLNEGFYFDAEAYWKEDAELLKLDDCSAYKYHEYRHMSWLFNRQWFEDSLRGSLFEPEESISPQDLRYRVEAIQAMMEERAATPDHYRRKVQTMMLEH